MTPRVTALPAARGDRGAALVLLTKKWRAVIALGVFGALLAIVGSRHEPWFDEGQAWLLSRDATLRCTSGILQTAL